MKNLLKRLPYKKMARKSSQIKVEQDVTEGNSYWNKISQETQSNQSKVSMVLGALIILVAGILVFNYFNKGKEDLGPAQQIGQEDVSPGNLPGKYTVKEGDTLFLISEKYYQDGYKYTEIAKANNLSNVDQIETGQVLEIPRLEVQKAQASPTPSPSASVEPQAQAEETATGGGNTTIWGPKIEGDSYTVVEGDWLSTIAARAYGDIMAYQKLAEANSIANPDLILPGQTLKIPR